MPSRTARKRGNAFGHSSRVELAMIRSDDPPPNRSHCTTVHRRIVLAGHGIDPGFIARRAFDPHRLVRRDARIAQSGNGGGGLLRKAPAIVRLLPGTGAVRPITM